MLKQVCTLSETMPSMVYFGALHRYIPKIVVKAMGRHSQSNFLGKCLSLLWDDVGTNSLMTNPLSGKDNELFVKTYADNLLQVTNRNIKNEEFQEKEFN